MKIKTDNTRVSNGVIINNRFYPKRNLQSGTLRIILTTKCNYQCRYCFAEGEKEKDGKITDLESLKKIIKVGKEFGINKIKLTGGEPLLYPHMDELLEYIRKIEIPYVDLTTNISLLTEKNIKLLNKYSVNAITLSLNTLEEDKFIYLSNYPHFEIVKQNFRNTVKLFKGKIRVNCVVFDEKYDEEDYREIISMCKRNNLGLRLIEPSKVEGLKITYTKEKFHELIEKLRLDSDNVVNSDCSSVEYLFFGKWYITVMHSLCDNNHCNTCTKYMYIRVTSDLKLKPCLSRVDTEVPINTESEEEIEHAFIKAISYMGVGINSKKCENKDKERVGMQYENV